MSQETKICKHCQSEIPKKAKVCPHCRKKQGGKLGWVVIGIGIALVIVAVAGGGDNKPKKVAETDAAGAQAQDTQSEEKEAVFKKGETAELNDVQVTMTDYKESTGSEYNAPTDGNVFLMSEFEIVNNTDREIAISSMISFEAYADDYALEYSVAALMEKEGNQLDGAIAPGKKMKGWIGWEVPQDYKNVEIHFTDNVWSNNKFVFLIEK